MSFSVQPIEVFSTSASAHCYDVNKSETISAIESVKMNKLQTSNNAAEEDQAREETAPTQRGADFLKQSIIHAKAFCELQWNDRLSLILATVLEPGARAGSQPDSPRFLGLACSSPNDALLSERPS